jgi:hypothetical protein
MTRKSESKNAHLDFDPVMVEWKTAKIGSIISDSNFSERKFRAKTDFAQFSLHYLRNLPFSSGPSLARARKPFATLSLLFHSSYLLRQTMI